MLCLTVSWSCIHLNLKYVEVYVDQLTSLVLGAWLACPGIFHPLDVPLGDHAVVNDRPGVILADDAACRLLHAAGGRPWLVDVLGGHLLQDWQVLPDESNDRKFDGQS